MAYHPPSATVSFWSTEVEAVSGTAFQSASRDVTSAPTLPVFRKRLKRSYSHVHSP